MPAPCVDLLERPLARLPEVDRVARATVAEALTLVEGERLAAAVLLTGSLAQGAACGALIDGEARLLSDVDLGVVPRPDAPSDIRDRLSRLAEEATRRAAPMGFVSHVDFGLLHPRVLARPRDRLVLHDLARIGITVAGDERYLATLRRRLAGRQVDVREGRILVLNRIAGQILTLPDLASPDPLHRLVARYQFAKAYADNRVALSIVNRRYPGDPIAHPVLERQATAARQWMAFREDPPADPGPPERLLVEWKATVRDQLEVARAAGALRLPRGVPNVFHALAWSRIPQVSPGWSERCGLKGSPLQAAHVRCVSLARALLDGRVDAPAWARSAREAVGFWRLAINGTDDTASGYEARVSELLGRKA